MTVYEKNDKAGGLLRYGIPDFKLPKDLIDRRIEQMQAEGVTFKLSTAIGARAFALGVFSQAQKTVSADKLKRDCDAVVLACGSEIPRDLKVPGREAKGVHFALELLIGQNRVVSGELDEAPISCKDRKVVIIGGGDTGSDCVGIARRQGAASIVQIDIGPCPPQQEDKVATWPDWPVKLRTSSSHEEGCERLWGISTKAILVNDAGEVRGLHCVKVTRNPVTKKITETVGSDFEIAADRVFLAMGFVQPAQELLEVLGIERDARGNALAGIESAAYPFATSVSGVFACGDVRSGQSLVVRAMSEGRRCARAVDLYLMGSTEMPAFRA